MANPTPPPPAPIPVPEHIRDRHLPGYVTLQSIVYDVLNEMGVYDFAEYKRLMQLAIRGLIYLNLYDLTNFRVVYLNVNAAGLAELPDDYIDWLKIGQIDSLGNIVNWSPNQEMYVDKYISEGNLANPYLNASVSGLDAEDLVGCIFAPHFYEGTYYPKLYGGRGGYAPGYFRIDREDRIIRCDRIPPGSKIVLEYNSSGVSIDGATWVPRQAVEPMIQWVHWKRKKEANGFTRGEIADAKQDFLEAEEALRAYEGAPTIQQLQDIIYESYTQGIKR